MKLRRDHRIVSGLLIAAFAGGMIAAGWAVRRAAPEGPRKARADGLVVEWRAPMAAKPNLPCALADGWVVTDAAGGVTALSREGRRLWQAGFSNQVFEAAASWSEGTVVVATQQGLVAGLKADTGAVVWTRETDGRFRHAPLAGVRGGESAVWLVSQDDGRLFCLRSRDGAVVWRSEPTNRCDGEPAFCQGRLAYGNCDGAIYFFDAESGAPKGSVAVGADDQMAGGMLVTSDGRVVAGTRQGKLVAVRGDALKLEAQVSVSSSEAFVKPAEVFGGLVATGTQEGDVVFWRVGEKLGGRVALGSAVDGLLFDGGRLYALAGGSLCVFESADRVSQRVALGDDVAGPVAGRDGRLACVADQSVVCLKGGGR